MMRESHYTTRVRAGLVQQSCWVGCCIMLLACGGDHQDAAQELGNGSAPHEAETVTATSELGTAVELAVGRWAAATGREWVYRGVVDSDVGASFHVQAGEPPEGFVAFAFANGRILVSPEWLDRQELPMILMHELGHAFRGDHHDHHGVMYYGLGDGIITNCITEADLEWACSDFQCTRFGVECSMPTVATVPDALPREHSCPLRAWQTGSPRAAVWRGGAAH